MSQSTTLQTSVQVTAHQSSIQKYSQKNRSQQSRYSIHDQNLKNLSFQQREGQIRLVNQIGLDQKAILDESITNIRANRKKFGTVNTSIDLKQKLNNSSQELLRSNFNASIDPLGDRNDSFNTSVIIRDLPPTLRYLTKNAFGQACSSPKESAKDVISSIRSIFYAQMSIDSKSEETLKLKEYILMELEKLEEARKTFDEDKDKFHKYLSEMEQQAEKAKESAESAQKQRQELNEKNEWLSQEIQKYGRDIEQIEDDLKNSSANKDFIDLIKAQRKFKSKPQELGGEVTNRKVKQQSTLNDQDFSKFFITEDQERAQFLTQDNNSSEDQSTVDLSKNEFMDIIQSLEDANIFLLDNIQTEEQGLEKMHRDSEKRFSDIQQLINDLQMNIDTYQGKINDKQKKKSQIKEYLKDFDSKGQGNSNQEAAKNQSSVKDQQMLYHSQMKHLKSLVNKIYYNVRQSTEIQEGQNDTVYQLGQIERKLELFLEARDFVIKQADVNPEQMKIFQEAVKNVDKDRKQIRYEKKKKDEQDHMREMQLKVERRMERSNKTLSVSQNRVNMARSMKPNLNRKQHDDGKKLTLEEIDYLKYVEGNADKL